MYQREGKAAYKANLDNTLKLDEHFGRPVHLMLHDHYKYKNHSVIALGYMQFRYDDYDSIYIRIADGWSRTANRYVWGMCYGTWNYVSVEV